MRKYLLCFSLVFLSFLTAQVSFHYLNGNDRNNGSVNKPFKTLHHALEAASQIKSERGNHRVAERHLLY
ncbi:MAG: hypothetical protein M9904_11910 [Chitinophagaceae bacterium]|nr:hypothetical protein [Chitinophagaceae bacterium]